MRYHPAVGLPHGLRLPGGVRPLVPTKHARDAALADGIVVPAFLRVEEAQLFEVVVEDDKVVKVGYRVPSRRDGYDICLVLAVTALAWVVVTCWANAHNDRHCTLRREQYATPKA